MIAVRLQRAWSFPGKSSVTRDVGSGLRHQLVLCFQTENYADSASKKRRVMITKGSVWKGKEDCSELLTVLAVVLKENYLLDPCVDF